VWAQTVVLDPQTGHIVKDTIQKRGVQDTDDEGNPLYVDSFEDGVLTTTASTNDAVKRDVPNLFLMQAGDAAQYTIRDVSPSSDGVYLSNPKYAFTTNYVGVHQVFTVRALGKGKFTIQRSDGLYLSRDDTTISAMWTTSVGPNETFEILSVEGSSSVVIRQGEYTLDVVTGAEVNFVLAADLGSYDVFELTEVVQTQLEPTDDTYIDETSTGSTHGSKSTIAVKTYPGYRRYGLLRFPMDVPVDDLDGATIAIDVSQFSDNTTSNFDIYGIKNANHYENLNEDTATYSNWFVGDSNLYDPDSSTSGIQPVATISVTGSDTNTTKYFNGTDLLKFLQTDTNGYATFWLVRVKNATSLNTSFASKEHSSLNPPRLSLITKVTPSDVPLRVFTDSADPINDPGALLWLREDGLTVDYERSVIYNVEAAIADVFYAPVPLTTEVNRTEATPIQRTVITTQEFTGNDTLQTSSVGTIGSADVYGATVWIDADRDAVMDPDEPPTSRGITNWRLRTPSSALAWSALLEELMWEPAKRRLAFGRRCLPPTLSPRRLRPLRSISKSAGSTARKPGS
jgi:hypothetical protein